MAGPICVSKLDLVIENNLSILPLNIHFTIVLGVVDGGSASLNSPGFT